jgi:hypothetical protein
LKKKLKKNIKRENVELIIIIRNTKNAEITLNTKSNGLDKKLNKKREKIKLSCLLKI